MVLTIVLSFGVGLFIFLIYKKTYRGVMYSPGFGTTLIALTMITATVILAVTSNVVLSLGSERYSLKIEFDHYDSTKSSACRKSLFATLCGF